MLYCASMKICSYLIINPKASITGAKTASMQTDTTLDMHTKMIPAPGGLWPIFKGYY